MEAPAADQHTTLSDPLVLPSPTLREQHPPAFTSDTTSTSLDSRVPDGSKMFVKFRANIFVVSFRIKTGSRGGHKQHLFDTNKFASFFFDRYNAISSSVASRIGRDKYTVSICRPIILAMLITREAVFRKITPQGLLHLLTHFLNPGCLWTLFW